MPSTSEELAAAGLDPSFADTAGGSLEAAHAADVIFPRSAAEGVITHARLMWPARLQAATICGSSMLWSADPHAQSPWVPGAGKGRRCSSCRLLAPSRAANRRPDVRRGPPRNDRGADVTAPPRLDSANHAGTESLRTRRWRKADSNHQSRSYERVGPASPNWLRAPSRRAFPFTAGPMVGMRAAPPRLSREATLYEATLYIDVSI
jgi:hypothetical protein